jgi:hypothetical protein
MEVGGGGASGGSGMDVGGGGASATKCSGDCEGSGHSDD